MKAWELLSDESKWCRNAFARNEMGFDTSYSSDEAVCWCATGAIMKVYGNNPQDNYGSIQWDKLCYLVFSKSWWSKLKYWFRGGRWNPISALAKWNDDPRRTYKEVYSTLKELDI